MRNVIVIGSGSAQVAAAIRILMIREGVDVAPGARGERVMALSCQRFADVSAPTLLPPTDDPFKGGGRSKGEKKRAARERRIWSGRA